MALAMMPLPADRFLPRGDDVFRFPVTALALLAVGLLVAFFADDVFDADDFAEDFAVLFFVVFAVDALGDDERADDFEEAAFEVGAFAAFDDVGFAFVFAPPDDVFDFFAADFAAVDFLGVGIFLFLQNSDRFMTYDRKSANNIPLGMRAYT
jgi:hypothetical protein